MSDGTSALDPTDLVRRPGGVVFLVGMPRSGTTMLIERLARHPDVVATPETHFFPHFCPTIAMARKRLRSGAARELHAELSRRLRSPQGGEGDCRVARPRDFAPRTTVAEVARTAFADLLAETQKKVLIEKTPGHGFHMDAITAVFPAARFVFLVRDPRDVALSWMNVPWNPAGILWPGIRWASMARQVSRRARADDLAVVMVRYEDLLAKPEVEMNRLLAFLGLPSAEPEPAVHGAATFDPDAEPWKARAVKPLDSGNMFRWRSEMAPTYQFLFDCLLGRLLDRYGYQRAGISLRSAGRANIVAAVVHECHLIARRLPLALARRAGFFGSVRRAHG